MDKIFFHIDVNSAFLSWTAVEQLRQGSTIDLREIPAIIGGDQASRHGIVLAKSIPAKQFGIETAEPVAMALRKCPTLTIASPNMTFYKECSRKLMEYLSNICPDIEQVSIDECYMDFTPVAHRYASYLEAADRIREGVKNTLGFTVNVGISDRKVLAKMASDFKKPDRTHTLFSYEIQEKMWPLPVSSLYMCGRSSIQTLRNLGITTIGELAKTNISILTAHLKSHGKTLYEYANGIDSSSVQLQKEEAKGIGHSTTMAKDAVTVKEAHEVLKELARKVSDRLRKNRVLASMVSCEIKYASFRLVSHQTTLISPSASMETIYESACNLFDSLWDGTPVRLLGIRTSKLVDESEPAQMTIFDYEEGNMISKEKDKRLRSTMEEINARFGAGTLTKGTPSLHKKK